MSATRTRAAPRRQPSLRSKARETQFKVNPPKQLERTVRGYGGFSVSASGQMQKPRVRILTTFDELREAQEQSERMRERGYLRTTFKGSFYQFPGTPEISKKNRTR